MSPDGQHRTHQCNPEGGLGGKRQGSGGGSDKLSAMRAEHENTCGPPRRYILHRIAFAELSHRLTPRHCDQAAPAYRGRTEGREAIRHGASDSKCTSYALDATVLRRQAALATADTIRVCGVCSTARSGAPKLNFTCGAARPDLFDPGSGLHATIAPKRAPRI
jgi:hypothetical protein